MDAREEAKRSGKQARLLARHNEVRGSNTGIATGVYCNLAVIPAHFANDFQLLCKRNPVPLPLLEQLETGSHQSKLADDSDVSTDVPLYNIYQNGALVKEGMHDISTHWGPDHVGFLLGCSFTLESALATAGLKPRNMLEGKAPPVYVTKLPLNPSGVFTGGSIIASMRWYQPADLDAVRDVTRAFPRQHGEPIAWGWDGAEALGLRRKIEQQTVDWGDWSEPAEGEVPIFWGCGVTAEYAIQAAKLPGLVMTHRPGTMFVTDCLARDFEI